MARCPYCCLSSLFGVLLVVLSAKCNGAFVTAFLTEDIFCAARPIPSTCRSTLVKQPSNVCASRIFHIDTHSTILSAETSDGDNGKYLGALHRAVQTGDTRKLGKHKTFWVERCLELVKYKRKHGNCDVRQPEKRSAKKTRLQNWVNNQRTQYRLYQQDGKSSSITEERIAILEGMGFKWEITGWSGEQTNWKMRYEELKQYKERYGDCNVPQKSKDYPKLVNWVDTQRKQYRYLKEGKLSDMTDKRIKMLEEIGFDWYVNGPQVDWELRYDELKQYKGRYGDCNVPQRWKENPQLGKWVTNQRTQYRLLKESKTSTMTAERIEMLEKIGFDWYVNVGWEFRYDDLKQYKGKYGDCNVPQRWKENPQLGKWVTNQRTQYRLLKEGKKSDMTDERIEMLEKIGFEWRVRPRRKTRN